MARINIMTIGLILVFLGAQFFFVRTYVLTPQASRFVAERLQDQSQISQNGAAPSYYRAAYNPVVTPTTQKRISPPTWLCWPTLFLGVVLFLHGIALRQPKGGS